MGIQQWRRRTALPVSVAIDDQQDNLSPTSSAPVQRDGNSQVGFTGTASEPIHGGGSGSLRQAWIKSQTNEVKAPLEDKVNGSSVELLNQEAVLDESAVLAEPKLATESQPSVKEHSSQLQTPSTEQKPLSSESSAEPNESTAKAVTVALDISDLLGSVEQETQEGDFYQGEELSDATDNVALESFGIETVGDKSHEQPQADQLSTLDWDGLQSIIETNEHRFR